MSDDAFVGLIDSYASDAHPLVVRLQEMLADRGWSDADLAALEFGNVLRVLDAAHSRAREIAAERSPSTARIEDLDGPLRAPGAP
mgnify:CR=1 FL=1